MQILTVELPDRSGELLKYMLDSRVWEPDLHRQIGLAAGAMLFLRADRALPGESGDAFTELIGSEADEAAGQPSDPEPWTPALMAPDARTVDLLQAVLDAHTNALPLAIIISAWDRLDSPGAGAAGLARRADAAARAIPQKSPTAVAPRLGPVEGEVEEAARLHDPSDVRQALLDDLDRGV